MNVYSGNNVNNNNLGFRLPTESEWYVAAAVLYNWEDVSTTNFDYTVQVGSGVINCNYWNILNCGGEAKDVGSYSDLSDCTYCLESTSPNGLYDCNGNVKEWVEKSSNIYEVDEVHGRGVLIPSSVIKKIVISNRATFYCPQCQKN